MKQQTPSKLVDSFGRTINYLRLSVTDRCDFRCTYCMAEKMDFLPRSHILSLEELAEIGQTFAELGVDTIRLTGGEPLIRKNISWLARALKTSPYLKELNLSTNGSQLEHQAYQLKTAGIDRINISLDSLDTRQFNTLTRTGSLDKVLAGIDAANTAGFKKIKLNTVIMGNHNEDQIIPLIDFAIERNLDISFIEEMPLGNITEHDRSQTFFSSQQVQKIIAAKHPLTASNIQSPGPSRYYVMANHPQSKVGFISPHSNNFCGDCNRLRVTVEGKLLLCLGNENALDLKAILRAKHYQRQNLKDAIQKALQTKPKSHHFSLDEQTDIVRFMNATGG